MTERHLKVAFYQGQTGPDKTPTSGDVLSVKHHLKVAFKQGAPAEAGVLSGPAGPDKTPAPVGVLS